MDIETISGLHKCQPKNEPVEGETKNMVVLHMPAKNGKKAWIKIKSELPEKGGSPYRIVSVTPTGWEPDNYGNLAYNLEVEAVAAQPKYSDRMTPEGHADEIPQAPVNAPQSPPASHNHESKGELANYAAHAATVFAAAWDASKLSMALIPAKDAEELRLSDWYDLRLRIAQGFAIEINKIIRKERF